MGLRETAPENSPASSAKSLPHKFLWYLFEAEFGKSGCGEAEIEGAQTVKCKPWTERVAEKGLSRGVSRAPWRRRRNRESEAKKAHKPWICEGLNRVVQTENWHFQPRKFQCFSSQFALHGFARPWRKQWREAPFHWMRSRHSANEAFSKEFYAKGNSLKRFRPFSESLDSENWVLLRSSPS